MCVFVCVCVYVCVCVLIIVYLIVMYREYLIFFNMIKSVTLKEQHCFYRLGFFLRAAPWCRAPASLLDLPIILSISGKRLVSPLDLVESAHSHGAVD